MRVLVACEFSGIVREAFIARGHDAWSCDLLDTEIPGNHIKDNVLDHLNENWNLMIAHPPCTYLCNSGVRWLHSDSCWNTMEEAALFFKKLFDASIEKIAVENPIPHKYATEIIGKYRQIIQPWEFGHGEVKATCLWLKNLSKLNPSNIVDGREAKVHKAQPGKNRWMERSRTYTGIAQAMANQWG